MNSKDIKDQNEKSEKMQSVKENIGVPYMNDMGIGKNFLDRISFGQELK